MERKKVFNLKMLVVLIILLSSCANNEVIDACLEGKTYNFWGGIWHGIIAPFNFIAMFFREDVTIYAPNNTGAWYGLGFLIGSGGWGLLGGKRLGRKGK